MNPNCKHRAAIAGLALAALAWLAAPTAAVGQDQYFPEGGTSLPMSGPAACASEVQRSFPQECGGDGTKPSGASCGSECEKCCEQSATEFPIDLTTLADSCECLRSTQNQDPNWFGSWWDCIDAESLNPLSTAGLLAPDQRAALLIFLAALRSGRGELEGLRQADRLSDDIYDPIAFFTPNQIEEARQRLADKVRGELAGGMAVLKDLRTLTLGICDSTPEQMDDKLVEGCKNFCRRAFPPPPPDPPEDPASGGGGTGSLDPQNQDVPPPPEGGGGGWGDIYHGTTPPGGVGTNGIWCYQGPDAPMTCGHALEAGPDDDGSWGGSPGGEGPLYELPWY